jgi:hypothetical protein
LRGDALRQAGLEAAGQVVGGRGQLLLLACIVPLLERDGLCELKLLHVLRVQLRRDEGLAKGLGPVGGKGPKAALEAPPQLTASLQDWPAAATLSALPWEYYVKAPPPGKYDEPVRYRTAPAPSPEDHSVRCEAAWDAGRLYIRLIVMNTSHRQGQEPSAMGKKDGVQVALTPHRSEYRGALHSWYYLMGGYRGNEVEFGVSLRGGRTQIHLGKIAPHLSGTDPTDLIQAAAARHGNRTVYEVAASWQLIPGFAPRAEKSVGIAMVVNDIDAGRRRCAAYGGGAVGFKRPAEFTALRLVKQEKK